MTTKSLRIISYLLLTGYNLNLMYMLFIIYGVAQSVIIATKKQAD